MPTGPSNCFTPIFTCEICCTIGSVKGPSGEAVPCWDEFISKTVTSRKTQQLPLNSATAYSTTTQLHRDFGAGPVTVAVIDTHSDQFFEWINDDRLQQCDALGNVRGLPRWPNGSSADS